MASVIGKERREGKGRAEMRCEDFFFLISTSIVNLLSKDNRNLTEDFTQILLEGKKDSKLL